MGAVCDIYRYLLPRSWSRGWLIVLGGYIDGSNLHDSADIVAVGGCAAVLDQWPRWEQKWDELLAVKSVLTGKEKERWHHTDFIKKVYQRAGEKIWRNWPEAEWLLARNLLCEAFERINSTYIGATVKKSDYQQLRDKYGSLPEDAYYFLLDRCLHRLIQGMFEYPKDEGVIIYCDHDRPEAIGNQLAEWHTEYLRQTHDPLHPEDKYRTVNTSYGFNVDHKPLQAADVIAHEIMSFTRRNPDMSFIATNADTGSPILERLKRCGLSFVICLSKPMLEAELDGSAWVPGFPSGYRFAPPEL